jgi:fatty-acyl-CoA synthase
MIDGPVSACWTLPDHVDRAAGRWPGDEALVFAERRISFGEFAAGSRAVARGLRALGIAPGETVGLFMRNVPDMLVALYGVPRVGAIAVPVNGRFKARELAFVLGHAECAALVISAEYAPIVAEALASEGTWQPRHVIVVGGEMDGAVSWEQMLAGGDRVAPAEIDELSSRLAVRDPAMLMYTSGTTADPKGCLISHESLVRTARIFGHERFPTVAGDRVWDPLPLFHMASLLPFNACLQTGATYVGQEHFDAGQALAVLQSERCNKLFAAFDLIWAAVLDHPDFAAADLGHVSLINVNGVPERLIAFQARTPWITLISPYGATEGGGVMALSHLQDPVEQRTTWAGRPFAGMQVRIVDPATGEELASGERGEITYRGPALFDGYHRAPEATAAAIDADGWFHSGDLGMVDSEGRMRYIGRLKDMLKVGGENVAAAEIEGFLAEHPSIATVAIVAAPDESLVEVACAYVALAPGTTLEHQDIVRFCYGRIASYKIPRYLRVIEEWPMSGTKIQKFRLREQIAAELAAVGVRSAPRITPPDA